MGGQGRKPIIPHVSPKRYRRCQEPDFPTEERLRLRTTSQSASQTAPLVGEPLAKPFTLRGLPKPPLGRSNGDDRRQWRKQGGAVGAAASRMRAAAKQTLGAATRAVARRRRDGEVELLSLWESWREAPERAHPLSPQARPALLRPVGPQASSIDLTDMPEAPPLGELARSA